MIEATIKIQRGKGKRILEIPYKQPEHLDEMSLTDWLTYCAYLTIGMKEEELMLRMFFHFLKMNLVDLAVKVPEANPLELIECFINSLKKLTSESSTRKCFFTGTNNKLFDKLDGAGENLGKMRFVQFGMADSWMSLWLNEPEEKYLNNFCGAYFSDQEKGWSRPLADKLVEYFEKYVPPTTKIAVLRNFQAQRTMQEKDFPHFFPAPGKGKAKGKVKFQLNDWDGFTIEVAETGIFGNKMDVENAPAREVLKYLDRLRKNHKKK